MSDFSIRRVTIAEQADLAAQRTVETGERQPNPHFEGSEDARSWEASYERALQRYTSPESEGSA